MIITAVKSRILYHDYSQKVDLAHMTFTERALGLIQIQTDEGLTGWGEFDVTPTGDKTVGTLIDETFGPRLIGKDPTKIGEIIDDLRRPSLVMGRTRSLETYAVGAIDMALWDILGKAANKPISHLLGHYRESLPVYASLGYEPDPVALAETVSSCYEKGFSGVKIRIGVELEKDEILVKAARQAAGDRILMADANAAWPRLHATQYGRILEKYNLKWLEEPMPVGETSFVSELAARLDTPLAIGEHHIFSRIDASDIVRNKSADILQPDLRIGISECAAVAAIGSGAGIPCIPHFFAGAVRFAATLQLLGGIQNAVFAEHPVTGDPLFEKLCGPAFTIKDGYISIPQNPGLGVEPLEEEMKKYI